MGGVIGMRNEGPAVDKAMTGPSTEQGNVAMAETVNISKCEGRIDVHLSGCFIGDDLQVSIFGGDRPHIGAVAVSYRHPSLKDRQIDDVTTSVLAITGHKEDVLARNAAHRIAAETGLTTSVNCGIHLEQISEDEILIVMDLVEQLVDELIALIKAG